jgi:hypothetical protein
MTIALWPLDKKLRTKLNGEEFDFPMFVWGRLWAIFSSFGADLLTEQQLKRSIMPGSIPTDEHHHISAQHVQEILRRIDASIAAGTFEKDFAHAWEDGESGIRGLGLATKSYWPRFLEFARTLGIKGFRFRVESGARRGMVGLGGFEPPA